MKKRTEVVAKRTSGYSLIEVKSPKASKAPTGVGVRAYTILATWPEKAGAEMINNETGGRKEATGVWAWKLPSLEPGERTVITYNLSGLERGDWTETDVFFRGAQDVIGASKMDEKFLEEIRRQERALNEPDESDAEEDQHAQPVAEPTVAPPSGQTTLFGGDA